MNKREGISEYFFGKFINNRCEIEMCFMVDDVGKICSPDRIWTNRASSFREIGNTDIRIILIFYFYKTSCDTSTCDYSKYPHESTGFFESNVHFPSNTPVTVPLVFLMNSFDFFFQKVIFCVKSWSVVHERSGYWENPAEHTLVASTIFYEYRACELDLAHLFFWFAQPQYWALLLFVRDLLFLFQVCESLWGRRMRILHSQQLHSWANSKWFSWIYEIPMQHLLHFFIHFLPDVK